MSHPNPPPPGAVASLLLTWVRADRRDLPWRRRRDPYAVWISEVMLQQTQVTTVVPYFERWMARFPDISSLAAATPDDVLRLWAGLGYYARARNLHRMAQEIVARHGGTIPSEKKALLALPGIGRYTAGAILSLAFGQREPVLDGNVRRVLCRVYDIADDPSEAATERQLWQLATGLVMAAPEDAAGDLNEGLMELGALICTPGEPDCAACPIATMCLAHEHGVEAERPVKRHKARPPHYDAAAAIILDDAGRYLLIQRPAAGLLGGLWGFPGGVLKEGEVVAEGFARTVREQIGMDVAPGDSIATIRHAYTHFRITLHACRCRIIAGEPQPLRCAAVRWVAAGELTSYALPVTDAKIVQAVQLNTPRAPALPLETTP
jgi:A/G-specific adenine glycosylase